jgi:protein-tyrosine phosphatase
MSIPLYDTHQAMGFVDLHSHVLDGLDDGAPDQATSLAMLDALAALGVSEQCVTPHQKASQYLPPWDAVEAAFARLCIARRPHHPTLRLGAENMWDDVFYRRVGDGTVPGYQDTPAFLVEVPPPLLPVRMADQLFDLTRAGKVPVLAHPERYHALWGDDELARSLRRVCAFVVDLGAVAGFHGRREAKQARHLLEIGLAAAVATDAHQVGDVQQSAAGLAWIEKKLGHAAVVRLFDHAPRAILAGELPD